MSRDAKWVFSMKKICINFLSLLCFTLFFNLFPGHCYAVQVPQLKEDLKIITEEIRLAEEENSKYKGGLIKTLILVRIEILKTTKALIFQRIHSLDSNAPINIQINATKPDVARAKLLTAEINLKKNELIEAKKEALKYSGGLISVLISSKIATEEQTLAMLQQEYLRSKYGLAIPTLKDSTQKEFVRKEDKRVDMNKTNYAKSIITPTITNKKYSKETFEEHIYFDLGCTATNLKKSARSIKGVLLFKDLFGETMHGGKVTIDEPIKQGETLQMYGIGFEYSQFNDSHKWVRRTKLKNMTFDFEVKSILYQDGEREDIK